MYYRYGELIRTFICEESELYITIGENRYKFADCDSQIKVFKQHQEIPILNKGVDYKTTHVAVSISENIETTFSDPVEKLKQCRELELITHLRHEDGTIEKISFGIEPEVIDEDKGWECVINNRTLIKRLLEFK